MLSLEVYVALCGIVLRYLYLCILSYFPDKVDKAYRLLVFINNELGRHTSDNPLSLLRQTKNTVSNDQSMTKSVLKFIFY